MIELFFLFILFIFTASVGELECQDSATAGYTCCDEGYFCEAYTPNAELFPTMTSFCTPCGKGYYCEGNENDGHCGLHPMLGGGGANQNNCEPGKYCDEEGMTEADMETKKCLAGTYSLSGEQDPACSICEKGHGCDGNVNRDVSPFFVGTGTLFPFRCKEGYYCPTGSDTVVGGNATVTEHVCKAGYYCPTASYNEKGHYCSVTSAYNTNTAIKYADGELIYVETDSTCAPGYYCVEGSFTSEGQHILQGTPADQPCAAGYFCDGGALDEFGRTNDNSTAHKCTPGYNCEEGSTNAENALCPAGFKCPESIPVACEAGTTTLVDGVHIECEPCGKGTYAIDSNSCGNCLAGYYCQEGSKDEKGATEGEDYDHPCEKGYYCESGSFTKEGKTLANGETDQPCDAGYFCVEGSFSGDGDNVGNPGVPGDCEEGFFCPGGCFDQKGNNITIDENQPCGAGYYCPANSEDEKGTTSGVEHKCMDGYFCPEGSTEASMQTNDCPAGYYCAESDLSITGEEHQCDAGFYCEGKAYTSKGIDLDDTSIHYCACGYYCEQGSTDSDGSNINDGTPNYCGAGFYCPEGSTTSAGIVQGTSTPNPCPAGYYCDGTGTNLECTGEETTTQCSQGYYCREGSITGTGNTLTNNTDLVCVDGCLCDEGSQYPCDASCPSGSYCEAGIAKDCSGIDAFFADAKYCIVPQPDYTEDEDSSSPARSLGTIGTCEPNFKCNDGVKEPCELNTFSTAGQHSCGTCPDGKVCDSSNGESYYCPAGSYCVGGTESPCGCGYYCVEGSYTVDGQNLDQGLAPLAQPCAAGYYCPIGSGTNKGEVVNDSGEIYSNSRVYDYGPENECSCGTSCPIGSCSESECPAGSYSNGGSPACYSCQLGYYCNAGSCSSTQNQCAPGTYCPTGSTGETLCDAGYFCRQGAFTPDGRYFNQTTGALVNEPQCCYGGYYCPAGSYTGQGWKDGEEYNHNCQEGYYCDGCAMVETGNKTTTPEVDQRCDDRFHCPEGSFKKNQNECELGHYCQLGLIYECEKGTYSATHSERECTPCAPGYCCASMKSVDEKGWLIDDFTDKKCECGYYCEEGSIDCQGRQYLDTVI